MEGILGLHSRPPENVEQIVSKVSNRLRQKNPHVHILNLSTLQAFAYWGANAITLTKGMITHLDEKHLEAIVSHEIGHLKESLSKQIYLRFACAPLIGLAAYFPVVEQSNLGMYIVVAVTCWFAAGYLALPTRSFDPRAFEKRADEKAVENLSPEIYATALERIYEIHLIPAVLEPEDSPTHPNLYDRIKAAGVEPAYARPEQPSVNLRTLTLIFPLSGTVALAYGVIEAGWFH
jgi:Zn-dependent protease with chaperone function